jgi:hypothetical protein
MYPVQWNLLLAVVFIPDARELVRFAVRKNQCFGITAAVTMWLVIYLILHRQVGDKSGKVT